MGNVRNIFIFLEVFFLQKNHAIVSVKTVISEVYYLESNLLTRTFRPQLKDTIVI